MKFHLTLVEFMPDGSAREMQDRWFHDGKRSAARQAAAYLQYRGFDVSSRQISDEAIFFTSDHKKRCDVEARGE